MISSFVCDCDDIRTRLDFDATETPDSNKNFDKISDGDSYSNRAMRASPESPVSTKHCTSRTASDECESLNDFAGSIEDIIKLSQAFTNSLVTQQNHLTMEYRVLQQRDEQIAALELRIALGDESHKAEINGLSTNIKRRSDMLRQTEEELHYLQKEITEKEEEVKQLRAVVNLAERLPDVWRRENPKVAEFVQTFGELMKSVSK